MTKQPQPRALTHGLRTRILTPGQWALGSRRHGPERLRHQAVLVRRTAVGAPLIRNRRHLRPLTCVQAALRRDTKRCPAPHPPSQGSINAQTAPRHLRTTC
ncbi:hypothetical protein GWK47_045344 [Chionoecetes opilio]|uniref:Uncharacterized protein n=1 Tax=Chionoecetes opilio TaxID=41210 RepID=A0A8J4Y898_CHIOP|nr:hypothetical protein GWK47_045344 [Chionoecetes opilio]